jgi:hypothetical protein
MKTGITSVGTRVEWPEVPHCGVLYCRDFGFFYNILIKELFCIISLYGIYCHLLHIQHSETQLGRNPQKYIFIRCCKLKLNFFGVKLCAFLAAYCTFLLVIVPKHRIWSQ